MTTLLTAFSTSHNFVLTGYKVQDQVVCFDCCLCVLLIARLLFFTFDLSIVL